MCTQGVLVDFHFAFLTLHLLLCLSACSPNFYDDEIAEASCALSLASINKTAS